MAAAQPFRNEILITVLTGTIDKELNLINADTQHDNAEEIGFLESHIAFADHNDDKVHQLDQQIFVN
jgi:hypothetical protein